jgi:hypothetical protein
MIIRDDKYLTSRVSATVGVLILGKFGSNFGGYTEKTVGVPKKRCPG